MVGSTAFRLLVLSLALSALACAGPPLLCAAHHLHSIHGGTIRVSGAAPDLRWDLPLFSCISDRYV